VTQQFLNDEQKAKIFRLKGKNLFDELERLMKEDYDMGFEFKNGQTILQKLLSIEENLNQENLGEIIEASIACGAKVNVNNNFFPPVLLAISSQRVDLLQILIQNNANLNCKHNNQSMFHYAVHQKNQDIIMLFVKHKSDFVSSNVNDVSPLQSSLNNKTLDISFLIFILYKIHGINLPAEVTDITIDINALDKNYNNYDDLKSLVKILNAAPKDFLKWNKETKYNFYQLIEKLTTDNNQNQIQDINFLQNNKNIVKKFAELLRQDFIDNFYIASKSNLAIEKFGDEKLPKDIAIKITNLLEPEDRKILSKSPTPQSTIRLQDKTVELTME
jgi:hypothetical protein